VQSLQGKLVRLSLARRAALVAVGAGSFHLAFWPGGALAMLVYLFCAAELTRADTGKAAFRSGLILGLLVFAPKLTFFYTIFGALAAALWLVLAFWHGLFVVLGRWVRMRFSPMAAVVLLAALWTGIEYFRSELYYLKSSWFAPGYFFGPLLKGVGVYGMGFLLMLAAALVSLRGKNRFLAWAVPGLAIAIYVIWQSVTWAEVRGQRPVRVAGVQMEFPVELEVPAKLDALIAMAPETELIVLSEYTFDGPPTQKVREWCRKNRKYLVVGGRDPIEGTNYYNTAFVVGTNGEVVFKQAKSVPIQFFADGKPAAEQKVWDSPWGKIGICICYDLSYRRVVDGLVRQGAKALIVPTMDVIDWGAKQHELHARVAPVRAAEYGIPIFRVASSGISQLVDARGTVLESAPCPGEGAMIFGSLYLNGRAAVPWDAMVAPVCVGVSGIVLVCALGSGLFGRRRR
jgi:apolipoprotein N-acyltransferase